MKKVSVVILILFSILLASCSTKFPNLKDPEKGIVAIAVKASNTSSLDFATDIKIISLNNPDFVIKIFLREGEFFAFSNEIPPGKVHLSTIKLILKSLAGEAEKSAWEFEIPQNAYVEVQQGAVTLAGDKLIVEQSASSPLNKEAYSPRSADVDHKFESLSQTEMENYLKKLKNIEGSNKWKIGNKL